MAAVDNENTFIINYSLTNEAVLKSHLETKDSNAARVAPTRWGKEPGPVHNHIQTVSSLPNILSEHA